jgi:hypothetical protein
MALELHLLYFEILSTQEGHVIALPPIFELGFLQFVGEFS